MKIVTHPEAERETAAAAEYYENCVPGLGGDLLAELAEAQVRVVANPAMWAIWQGQARRYLLRRFPYSLVYLFHEEQVTVLAVMHNHRRPGYWTGRK